MPDSCLCVCSATTGNLEFCCDYALFLGFLIPFLACFGPFHDQLTQACLLFWFLPDDSVHLLSCFSLKNWNHPWILPSFCASNCMCTRSKCKLRKTSFECKLKMKTSSGCCHAFMHYSIPNPTTPGILSFKIMCLQNINLSNKGPCFCDFYRFLQEPCANAYCQVGVGPQLQAPFQGLRLGLHFPQSVDMASVVNHILV